MSISSRLLMVAASWWVLASVTLALKATKEIEEKLKEVGLCKSYEKWLEKLMPPIRNEDTCYYDDFDQDDRIQLTAVCFEFHVWITCRTQKCPTGYKIKMKECTKEQINTLFKDREGNLDEWNLFDDDKSSIDEDYTDRHPFRYMQIHKCHEELEQDYLPKVEVLDGELCYLYDDHLPPQLTSRSSHPNACFLVYGRHISCRVTPTKCPRLRLNDRSITKKLQCTTKMLTDAIGRDRSLRACRKKDGGTDAYIVCRNTQQFCVLWYRDTDLRNYICRFLDPCSPNTISCNDHEMPYIKNPCKSNPCDENAECEEIISQQRRAYPAYQCNCREIGQDPERNCKTCKYPKWGKNCGETCGACSSSNVVEFSKKQDEVDYEVSDGFCNPRTGCLKCQEGVRAPPQCLSVDCRKAKCRNNAVCKKGKWKRKKGHCVCPAIYTGVLCETAMSPEENSREVEMCEDSVAKQQCLGTNSSCYTVDGGNPMCDCEQGRAGDRCQHRCLKNTETCLFGSCVKGSCKCDVGYEAPFCTDTCTEGYYGGDCKSECGHCYLSCHHKTGKCIQNREGEYCNGPYIPPMCMEYNKSADTKKAAFEAKCTISSSSNEALAAPSLSRRMQNRLGKFIRKLKSTFGVAKVKSVRIIRKLFDIRRRDVDKTSIYARPTQTHYQHGSWSGPRRRIRNIRNVIRRRRQGGSAEPEEPGQVEVDFLVLMPKTRVSGAGFADQLAEDMKQNADDFDPSGQFTVDKNSIQVTQVSQLTSDSEGISPTLIVGVLLTLVGTTFGIMMVAVVRRWTKKSRASRVPGPLVQRGFYTNRARSASPMMLTQSSANREMYMYKPTVYT